MIGRSQGYLAATVCVLGFGACDAPEQASDLRPSGPPEVLAVLASNADDGITETATFCKADDAKRPGLVPANPNGPEQVCDDALSVTADEVTDTIPFDWYVRIQFDELLDPDVEDLEDIIVNGVATGQQRGTLVNTQPVVLLCNDIPIPYDGYYSPSGNSLSWPLGPSLFIQPSDSSMVATGSDCQVSINADVVVDKDGDPVPAAQLGPFAFKIAPLAFASTSPAALADPSKPPEMLTTIDATAPVLVTFNAAINAASLSAAEVTIEQVTTCTDAVGVPRTAAIESDDKTPQSIVLKDALAPTATPALAWEKGKTYRVTFADDAEVVDRAGGTGLVQEDPEDEPIVICFKTKP